MKACGADGDLPIYKYSYAIIIGESNYEKWNKLPGAKADVEAVEKALKEHGFTVNTLIDPTLADFNKAINDFKEKYDRLNPSRFVLYFSGHGYTAINSGNSRTDDANVCVNVRHRVGRIA